ncbi:MAG TPA: phosphoenolpyruvate synthase [Thermoanaerobaculia bacterium]|jgi:pyruvate,water dikinase|nr:phosphoenolpyruvate synthase [Thermoanaerobaculia bacterium]
MDNARILWLEELSVEDVARVGGKNASLGEMIRTLSGEGIRVPAGFATTADAYRELVEANGLAGRIEAEISAWRDGGKSLEQTGRAIRRLFLKARFPEPLTAEILAAYRELGHRYGMEEADVAVRSSATAEDLPTASFAGQQETFLNVRGEEEILAACQRCFASLFTDRAISYREEKGFPHLEIALSIGVQKMVRSDRGGAGVMFTLDTESGFPGVVLINAAWGLGETVVQGTVTPDQYTVFKPLLGQPGTRPILEKKLGSKDHKLVYGSGGSRPTANVRTSERERASFVLQDDEILALARWAQAVERHYGMPMDLEWAKDGDTGELFIVQARPETVQSQKRPAVLQTYRLQGTGRKLAAGLAIGEGIAAGRVCRVLHAADIERVDEGSILVTEMTDPDWVPIMKKVAGIVTDLGGRTCHAAIVARELGIPAIVGTGDGTQRLDGAREVTISCAEGEQGNVYEGLLPFETAEVDLAALPATRTEILLNLADPDTAFRWWRLPHDGIGLARLEFIITNRIQVHPMALARFDQVSDPAARRRIGELTRGYGLRTDYFVDRLAEGVAKIAASCWPNPAIVRMSDFKTNEYAELIGGRSFEPHEENPMIGWRGASRYYDPRYREGFALECRALRKVREEIGLRNVVVMIPFCRTLEEADRVLAEMAANGLERGKDGLEVYVMCEIPSNVLLAAEFAARFDGFSIGSNDLTQLTLGVDRDSSDLAHLFDERNPAVKALVRQVIAAAHAAGRKVGICGQAPSDYPDFAEFLVEAGIDSISLNPDSVAEVRRRVAAAEAGRGGAGREMAALPAGARSLEG